MSARPRRQAVPRHSWPREVVWCLACVAVGLLTLALLDAGLVALDAAMGAR